MLVLANFGWGCAIAIPTYFAENRFTKKAEDELGVQRLCSGHVEMPDGEIVESIQLARIVGSGAQDTLQTN